MHIILDPLNYQFMVRALIGGVMISIVAPIIGSFLIVRKMSLISDMFAHVALAGVAIGLFIGVDPILTGIVVTILSAVLIEYLRNNNHISTDSILGILLPGGLAISLIIVSLANGFNTSLLSYLFGTIATISDGEVKVIASLSILITIIVVKIYKSLFYTSFDEVSAKVSGINIQFVNLLLTLLTAITVSISIKAIGAFLIGALMIIPASTSMLLSRGFRQSILLSIFIAVIQVFSGIYLSYYIDLPAGATIVLLSLIVFLFISILKKKK